MEGAVHRRQRAAGQVIGEHAGAAPQAPGKRQCEVACDDVVPAQQDVLRRRRPVVGGKGQGPCRGARVGSVPDLRQFVAHGAPGAIARRLAREKVVHRALGPARVVSAYVDDAPPANRRTRHAQQRRDRLVAHPAERERARHVASCPLEHGRSCRAGRPAGPTRRRAARSPRPCRRRPRLSSRSSPRPA